MANQTANRRARQIPVVYGEFPRELGIAATERFFNGSMVFLSTVGASAGFAKRPSAASDKPMGVCIVPEGVDNTSGANGALTVKCKGGIWGFDSGSSGDLLAADDVGKVVYAIDDQTVGLTDGGGTRPAVGKLVKIESSRYYVSIGMPDSALVSGVGLIPFYLHITALDTAEALHVAMPVAGEIVYLAVTVNGDIATADAVITTAIGGTGITGGVLTIPNATYDEGEVIEAVPTALNVVARGDDFSATISGGDTAGATATLTGLIRAY